MPTPEFGAITFPFILGEIDNNNVARSVTQTMLSDTAELKTINRLAADRMFFFGTFNPGPTGEYGQEATHNYVFASCSNDVFPNSTDSQSGYNQNLSIIQYLGLSGERFVENCGDAVFSDILGTANVVRRAYQATGTNNFAWLNHDDRAEADLTQYALKQVLIVTNSMLSDSVAGGEVQDVYQFFSLDDLVSAENTEYDRAPTHSVIKDHVAFKITGGPTCPEKEFSPFVGASGDTSYGNVDTSNPAFARSTLQLTYPRITPTLTLTLKNPDFGNQDILSFAKIDRVTRGGTRKVFADSKWGEFQTFELTIRNLLECNVTIDQITTFLNTSLGKEIGLRDWEGNNWKGVISAPDTDIVKEVNGTTVRIVFEGEPV